MLAKPPTLPTHVISLAEARALFGMIADARAEIAVIAYLAEDHRLIGLNHVVGNTDSVEVAPRMVAVGALRCGASRVMIGHNHPSGDPSPSSADIIHARRMVQALHPLDVKLVDQIIVAGKATTSFRALGLL